MLFDKKHISVEKVRTPLTLCSRCFFSFLFLAIFSRILVTSCKISLFSFLTGWSACVDVSKYSQSLYSLRYITMVYGKKVVSVAPIFPDPRAINDMTTYSCARIRAKLTVSVWNIAVRGAGPAYMYVYTTYARSHLSFLPALCCAASLSHHPIALTGW